ncbi:MAG: hypothetical protein Q9M50_10160 [Methylococcales bacterium]|nr:hypothetical protein [Methylococcales bacterium]
MRRKFYFVLLILSVFLTACQSSFGPDALNNTHYAYNQSIVNTLNQQMLLNLVRLKYRDEAYFLKINSVTESLTFGSSLGVGSELDLGVGGNLIKPSLGITYSDRPTISYQPLQGEDFLKSVLSPISLESLLVMTQSGWSIKRIFGLCVERINKLYNAPEASGPTPEYEPRFKKFNRMLSIFRKLQRKGDMEIGASTNRDNSLMIQFENMESNRKMMTELSEMLNFTPTITDELRVNISTNFLSPVPNQLTIRTRSISSILFYLSQSVATPQSHIKEGLVTMAKDSEGVDFNWSQTPAGSVFDVKFSEFHPGDAFLTIPYRGYWYYIDDNDLQSKSTFMLLMQLFNLQAGKPNFSAPTLTLPVR